MHLEDSMSDVSVSPPEYEPVEVDENEFEIVEKDEDDRCDKDSMIFEEDIEEMDSIRSVSEFKENLALSSASAITGYLNLL